MIVPDSTYRLQLDPAQMDLEAARLLVPYLARLGVSHLYSSPLFQARKGSTHGYDVVDPSRVNEELGGLEGLRRLVSELRSRDMRLLLDIVPNHLALGRDNAWWMEVLEHGPSAPATRFFDLFWDEGKLPLPLLGRPYAEALEEGELVPVQAGERLEVAYWEERFPIDPASYPLLLEGVAGMDDVLDLAPEVGAASGERRVALGREVHDAFARALRRAGVAGEVEEALAGLGAERLHTLLEAQHYRLAWWQLSRERLGHRRFFTITELVGLRQEDRLVFEETHRLLRHLVDEGLVDGLRIDHVDGLRDPLGYLRRLQRRVFPEGEGYVVVEKILTGEERLPEEWPVAGTTGYEHGAVSGGVFVDPAGYEELSSFFRRSTGGPGDFADLVRDQKRFILLERLGPETARLAASLEELADDDRWARDVIPSQLLQAAVEVIAALPVYRTYARLGELPPSDRLPVEEALEEARRRAPEVDPRAFELLRRVLLLEERETLRPGLHDARAAFVERVQQLTSATMAKGVEDTAFYQYNALLSLNEVGSHPVPFPSDPVAAYHAHNAWVSAHLPHTLTATSTHDTKRSEDVRSRISTLSQVAEPFAQRVEAWAARNRRHRGSAEAGAVPTRNEELFIYQTLIGSFPMHGKDREGYADRLAAHLVKAAREAKVHTAWLEPDPDHEEALVAFVRGVVGDDEFLEDLVRFATPLWAAGAVDSLSQLTLRLAAPGVPDLYRGSEMWDLSLTDPDNRRPVDWDARRRALEELEEREAEEGLVEELLDHWEDGRIKLYVAWKGLHLRRRRPDLLREGEYLPLTVEGSRADHLVAFARRAGDAWAVAAVPRLTLRLTEEGELWPRRGWEGTVVVLPEDAPAVWRSVLTREETRAEGGLPANLLLARFPVALLEDVPGGMPLQEGG